MFSVLEIFFKKKILFIINLLLLYCVQKYQSVSKIIFVYFIINVTKVMRDGEAGDT